MDYLTDFYGVPGRYPTAAAIRRINSLLGISEDQYGQDWEFEMSDASRLHEYLDIYENQLTNDDERFSLMAMIVDAYEHSDLDPDMWSRIRGHLKAEFHVHQYTVLYWCVMEEEFYDKEVGNWWDITPRMRELWNECRNNQKPNQ